MPFRQTASHNMADSWIEEYSLGLLTTPPAADSALAGVRAITNELTSYKTETYLYSQLHEFHNLSLFHCH